MKNSFSIPFNLFNEIPGTFVWIKHNSGEYSFSEGIKDITGLEVDYFEGSILKFRELIEDLEYEEIKEKIFLAKSSEKKSASIQYSIRDGKRNIRWLKETIIVNYQEDEKIIEFGLVEEITEKVLAEKTKQQSLLEKSDKLLEKDKFINIISHDLRSPFTSIIGFAEVLVSEPAMSPSDKMEFLSYIYESSQNLLNMVDRLLDYSRLESGKTKPQIGKIEVKTVLYNAVSSLTRSAVKKNIEVKIKAEDETYVLADYNFLQKVIVFILSNSIKYSSEGSEIKITARQFSSDKVEFVISDTGTGIPEEKHSILFKLDEKFSVQGTQGEKGSGFSLVIAKEMITKMNGEIWFYSKPGEGTEFHFVLPLAKKIMVALVGKRKNAAHNKILSEFNDFEIIEKNNPLEAYSLIKENNPDEVILLTSETNILNFIKLLCSDRKIAPQKFNIMTNISQKVVDSLYKNSINYRLINLK